MDTVSHLPKEAQHQTNFGSNKYAGQSGRTRLVIPVIGGLLAALFGAFVLLHLLTPFDGARLQPGQPSWRKNGVVVTPIEEIAGGLRRGDLVTAVAGQPLEFWAEAMFRLGVNRPRWQVGQSVDYTVIRNSQRLDVAVTLKPYPLLAVARQNWGTIIFALVYELIALYVLLRRPRNQAAGVLFISASSILSATTWSFGLQISDIVGGLGFWLYKATSLGAYTLFWITGLHFMLVFPRPLPPVLKYPRLIPLIYILPYLWIGGYLAAIWPGATNTLDWLSRWTPAEAVPAAGLLALHLIGVVWQYQANNKGVTRQQIRWVVFGALLAGGFGFIFYILPGALGVGQVDPNLMGVIVLTFPLAIAVAIVRHNLFDIDTLLNRALVYGALTTLIAGVYIIFVGSLGALFQVRGNLFISLLATGVVAVLFQPLRERLQRTVNRLMYGERDEPYTVLSRLGQRLEASLSPDATLTTIVETVAQALRLPYVAIALRRDEGRKSTKEDFKIVAAYGLPVDRPVTLPLVYQSETIGRLMLAQRAPDESFTPAEQRLLKDIAHQAGVAAHAVRLTNDLQQTAADLQRARQRLVTAREEERRRIRRDLHDGLGPQLASQMLTIEAIGKLLQQEPDTAGKLLQELKEQSLSAIQDIRRLVYDLRPPALDDLGLVAALREGARAYQQSGLRITIDAPERLPPLPAAVEVAVYRIAQEALTNVVRHAQASTCNVQLSLDEQEDRQRLRLEIQDDGRGLPPNYQAGVGCQAMRERAGELGGRFVIEPRRGRGTHVSAWLPLAEEET